MCLMFLSQADIYQKCNIFGFWKTIFYLQFRSLPFNLAQINIQFNIRYNMTWILGTFVIYTLDHSYGFSCKLKSRWLWLERKLTSYKTLLLKKKIGRL